MDLISELPFYYILLCPAAGFLYAYFLYKKEKKKDAFSKTILYTLFSLRFFSVLIISLLLMNFLLKRNLNQTEKPLIILALDNSASVVAGKDSSEIKMAFVQKLDEINSTLSEKYNVQPLLFGNKVSQGNHPDFSDKETDISQLINEVDNNYSNQNIGALVICSDGIINKGMNPTSQAEKFKFPIYTVALGDTTLKKDLILQKVNHNQVVYLGNKFPVEVTIQCLKAKGQDVIVTLTKDGVKKGNQTVKINTDNFTQTINFILEAEKPGVQKYNVAVEPLNDESNTTNNSQNFIVDVIDTREKILILASAPHPDVAAIKESIESGQTYEVETGYSDFNKPLKPYSLVILHNIQLANSRIAIELTNNKQPFLVVVPKPSDNLPGLKINITSAKMNETEPVFNKNFSLFNLSDELRKYIKEFPAVNSYFGNYSTSASANALLFQKIGFVETENPLIVFNENSGLRSGIIVGDGIWRWKLRDFADHGNYNLFSELILKTIQYLSVKADKSFFRLMTKKIITENDPIEFTAEVYNQSYQTITEPDVTIALTDEKGKQYNYTMSKTSDSYFVEAGLFPSGEYNYKSTIKVNNQVYSQSGTITVKAIVAEKINTVADHTLLFQLAQATGGKLFTKNELDKLEKELMTSELIKPITYTQKQLNDLIDLKWIFFLILGLLSLEWFLRKRSGTI
jgi:hypothetical protein